MKKLAPFLLIPAVVLIMLLASRSNQEPVAVSQPVVSTTVSVGSSGFNADEAAMEAPVEVEDPTPPATVAERAIQLVKVADNGPPYSEELLALINEDKVAVFAYLNSIQYPEGDESDRTFNEITFVAKTLDHYYREAAFEDMLTEIEAISGSPYLYDAVLQHMIANSLGRHEGRETEQFAQIYEWVANNPEQMAAQDAGTKVGGMLYMTDPENAWKQGMKLPEGRIRMEAMSTIMTQGFVDDIEQTSKILNELEMHPDLDRSVSNLVYYGLQQSADHDVLVGWARNNFV